MTKTYQTARADSPSVSSAEGIAQVASRQESSPHKARFPHQVGFSFSRIQTRWDHAGERVTGAAQPELRPGSFSAASLWRYAPSMEQLFTALLTLAVAVTVAAPHLPHAVTANPVGEPRLHSCASDPMLQWVV